MVLIGVSWLTTMVITYLLIKLVEQSLALLRLTHPGVYPECPMKLSSHIVGINMGWKLTIFQRRGKNGT